MRNRSILFVAASLIFGACSSTPVLTSTPDADGLAAFKSGENGMIVMNTSGNLGCDTNYLGFQNKDTKDVNVIVSKATKTSVSEPALISVKPGKHSLVYGRCFKYGYTGGELPSLRRWFVSFDVGPGEVVYPGTLNSQRIPVKARKSTLGTIMSLSKNTPKTFVSFQLDDNSPEIRSYFAETYPEIASKINYDPPFSIFTADEYQGVMQRTYAADENGKFPSEKEANERYREEIKKQLSKSILRLADEFAEDEPTKPTN